MDRTGPENFYTSLPAVGRFRDLAAIEPYRPVPDGSILFLADIVSSTSAIAAGRYKAVNVAAAAVIAAVRNRLAGREIAFSFGGDGAVFVLEAALEGVGRATLAAVARWVREELDLTLRIGAVPASAIRAAGHDLRVARFAVSPSLTYAMFAGGGVAFAEAEIKRGRFAVPPAEETAEEIDLTGLSCRFAPLPARNGTILSIIVVPASPSAAPQFARVATALLDLAQSREADPRPVAEGGPRLEWSLANFRLEAKATAAKGRRRLRSLARTAARTAVAHLFVRNGLSAGRFDTRRYLAGVVLNSDFRKFDDGLRMTLDCSAATADAIDRLLADEQAREIVFYGTHRQDAAVLTCFVPSPVAGDHVHFVDGAAGGYALAAAALKRQQAAARG